MPERLPRQVRAALQTVALFSGPDATMHNRRTNVGEASVIAKRGLLLRRQFARRLEHEATEFSVLAKQRQNRQREGGCLARAGLGGADQILSSEHDRKGAEGRGLDPVAGPAQKARLLDANTPRTTASPMDEARFWRLVEEAGRQSRGHIDRQVQILVEKLAELTPEEIIEFDSILDRLMALSYRRDLWAAAYIINGGCSDDGFEDFRGWLLAQGKDIFHEALEDPGTLVDRARFDEAENEDMLYAAKKAYQKKMGAEMPQRETVARELVGEHWDEEEVHLLFPTLAARFG